MSAEPIFMNIPIDKIEESKTNPRRHFNAKSIEELAASIKEKGVLEPVLVRERKGRGKKAGGYEIIAGARRFRASKLADQKTIPAMIREMGDDEVLEVQVIENLQREDVHPLEEADGFQALLDRGVYDSPAAVAEKVGKPAAYVLRRLNLRKLTPGLQKAFEENEFGIGWMDLAARLDEEWQNRLLGESRNFHGPKTPRDLAIWIKRNVTLDIAEFPFDLADESLNPKAGGCLGCVFNSLNDASLFPEERGGEHGRCARRSCYEEKLRAFLKRRCEAIEKEAGKSPLLIGGHNDVAGFKPQAQFWNVRSAKKADKKAIPGILIDADNGEWQGKPIGTMVWVRWGAEESEGGKSTNIKEDRAARLEELRLQRAECCARAAILTRVRQDLAALPESKLEKLVLKMLPLFAGKATLGRPDNFTSSNDPAKHPGLETARKVLGIPQFFWEAKDVWAPRSISRTTHEVVDALLLAHTTDEVAYKDGHTDPATIIEALAAELKVDVDLIRLQEDWKQLKPKARQARIDSGEQPPEGIDG